MVITPEITPLYETIASDAYWDDATNVHIGSSYDVTDLALPESPASQRYVSENIYDDPAKAKEIIAIVRSMPGGGTGRILEQGEPIPMPSASSREIIKVVSDCRISRSYLDLLHPQSKAFRRWIMAMRVNEKLRQKNGLPSRKEEFEANAPQMVDPDAYYVPSRSVLLTSKTHVMFIDRSISYVKADDTNKNRVSYEADFIRWDSPEDSTLMLTQMPPTEVGSVYGIRKACLTKVIAATVLEPDGIIWTHDAPKKPPKTDEKKRVSWLPKLGLSPAS